MKENLPLELYIKHREALGLQNPVIFDNENALFEKRNGPIESALVFLPKSKALIHMTLALVSGMVKEDGTIVLAGTNDAGIRSANTSYEANIGPVEQKIVGNHSALYVGKNKKLGAGKKVENYLSYSPLIYKDIKIDIANVPGVFSAGVLDAGTKLLLDTIPYDKKKVLDVGCGAGVIGALYKKMTPESNLTMSDSSEIAVLSSQKTLEKNGVVATVTKSDIFSNISGTFDLILCNPPFHTGVSTDYSFIERFAKDTKKHLNPGGEVYVVANSFLPYKETLEKYIGPTEILIDDKKFRVYKSRT